MKFGIQRVCWIFSDSTVTHYAYLFRKNGSGIKYVFESVCVLEWSANICGETSSLLLLHSTSTIEVCMTKRMHARDASAMLSLSLTSTWTFTATRACSPGPQPSSHSRVVSSSNGINTCSTFADFLMVHLVTTSIFFMLGFLHEVAFENFLGKSIYPWNQDALDFISFGWCRCSRGSTYREGAHPNDQPVFAV